MAELRKEVAELKSLVLRLERRYHRMVWALISIIGGGMASLVATLVVLLR